MPSRARRPGEAPTLQPFGQEAQSVTGGPQQFNLICRRGPGNENMAGHGIVFQRRLVSQRRPVEAISHIGDTGNQPNFGPEGNGLSLQFLYQQSQELFAATLPFKAERPVPERYLTADTEGFRVLCE